MIIAVNFGYYSPSFSTSGVCRYYPVVIELDNFTQFSTDIRCQVEDIFKWAKDHDVIPSTVALFVTVGRHNFPIRMINVREYREMWESKYNTEWKFDRKI
jgi:hypothetical protein